MVAARTREEGLGAVRELVAKFTMNRDHYLATEFTETATRNQFIDPLLEALGWDVADGQGIGASRDVLVESQQRSSPDPAGEEEWDDDLSEAEISDRAATTTFPDYVLRIQSVNRIVVEAKKPSVNLRFKAPSFQAKSYAWSMRLPIAVLTDFQELRVFDTRYRPEYGKPNDCVVPGLDLEYDRFVENWDLIWDLLSREAVEGGSLDSFARAKAKKGAKPVDQSFLAELADWRMKLATELKAHNPDLDRYEVAEATQRILDRLVFIRTMEDRGILSAEVLRSFARKSDAYRKLIPELRRLDARYNGQIFSEHFSERLDLPDGLFQRLVQSFYYPFSPYRFDAVPTDLLGSIYERFLGQEIAIEDGAVAVVDKPEVRHAGGIYYTPRWVVDRIVQTTLGPLVKGKTPKAVANLRIVDCACGSGAFLLGAFSFLVNWHEAYYEAHPGENPDGHFRSSTGERRLTADAKAEILSNNLYGVDIDPQAVEVTQMSLYLAMLSQETSATLRGQPRLFETAYLPRLDQNIRCGNSLLSTLDVSDELFSDEDLLRRINPFDWRDDRLGFGKVFADRGGFDVAIMNPPYVRTQDLKKFRPEEVLLYQGRYAAASEGSFDLASLFIEKVLDLIRPDGAFGFITTRTFMETASGRPVRKLLAEGRHVREIVDFVDGLVFEGASAYTAMLFAGKKRSRRYRLTRVPPPPEPSAAAVQKAESPGSGLTASLVGSTLGPQVWDLLLPGESEVLDRLHSGTRTLSEVCGDVIFQGPITGADYLFQFNDGGPVAGHPELRRVAHRKTGQTIEFEKELLRPVVDGSSDVHRFWRKPSSQVLFFPYERSDPADAFTLIGGSKLHTDFPNAAQWLDSNEEALRARSGKWTDDNWWNYSRRQNLERFSEPKVLVPYLLSELCAFSDLESQFFVNVSTGGYGIPHSELEDPEFVAALLNSELLSWVLKLYSRAFRGGWFAARKATLARLPIVEPDASERKEVVQLLRECELSHARLASARSDENIRRADQLHRRNIGSFNRAVERLYGLTQREHQIVHGSQVGH